MGLTWGMKMGENSSGGCPEGWGWSSENNCPTLALMVDLRVLEWDQFPFSAPETLFLTPGTHMDVGSMASGARQWARMP